MDAAIFGLIVADLIAKPMNLRAPPPRGGLELIESISLTTGGNVPNVGLPMAKFGMNVAAAGLVGNDVLGAAAMQRLKDGGMDTSAVFSTDKAQTAASIVAVEPGGERCFYHTPGATLLLDAAAFRRCLPVFKQSRWVQVGYHGLLPGLTADLPAVFRELREQAPSVKIAYDTVNPPAERRLLDPILPYLDLFAPSRTEAAALTGESSPAAMVAEFRKHMKKGLIGIKLDAEGCYLDDGKQAITVPACRITVVETTGAGDTWFGAMLCALMHDMPLEKAGRFANRAAADCCMAIGASEGVRSFEETMDRM